MPFSVRCVQYMVTSISRDQQYIFGVKSLLMVEKVVLMKKNLVAVLFRRPMQRSQRSILSCGQTGVWWDKCMHEYGRYVEKWNINDWRLNTFASWICSRLTHNAVQHLRVAEENCWAKYCTDWLRSKYKWRHSDDVIVIKNSSTCPQLNSRQNVYFFQNFHISKINRMMSFRNLFAEQPSYILLSLRFTYSSNASQTDRQADRQTDRRTDRRKSDLTLAVRMDNDEKRYVSLIYLFCGTDRQLQHLWKIVTKTTLTKAAKYCRWSSVCHFWSRQTNEKRTDRQTDRQMDSIIASSPRFGAGFNNILQHFVCIIRNL